MSIAIMALCVATVLILAGGSWFAGVTFGIYVQDKDLGFGFGAALFCFGLFFLLVGFLHRGCA